MTLDVKGRALTVPEAARGVAYFSFDDLCNKPLGTLDYLHIAHAFHTVIIEGIPKLPPEKRNEARRFINLIDTLYDARVGLIASAEAEPQDLYPAGDAAVLFERTVSRLIEMRSESYLESRAERGLGAETAPAASSA
jgi:cell division protein ZapE